MSARPRPSPQSPACDDCTQGCMDATNQHMWGRCECPCHEAAVEKPRGRPRPDYSPKADWPERYLTGDRWVI